MTNKGPLPNRPDPKLIRFDDDCFEIVGYSVYWVVSNAVGYGYPKEYATIELAKANCFGTQTIAERIKPIRKRIRWY